MKKYDVIVIGAGAAGLMCAIEAGKRGRQVLVIDHANKVGKKILMSGGGRCNFTNTNISAEKFLSHNPHFCKSALSCYTQWDFIRLVEDYNIPYFEKTLGQLFCQRKAKDIVNMLLSECERAGVRISLDTSVSQIEITESGQFYLKGSAGDIQSESLVMATGGLSIPTMGATGFGYDVARQFSIPVYPTSAGLVPFTLHAEDKSKFSVLSGVSTRCLVSVSSQAFEEGLLFTHRGLSGPCILQLSSYWQPGERVYFNWLPDSDIEEILQLPQNSQKQVKSVVGHHLPKPLVAELLPADIAITKCASLTRQQISRLIDCLHTHSLVPSGTEGYRTAEVTLGGVDTNALSSKTMQVKSIDGLYFIGEVVDVTGWLGGYNFQWAWSSGFAAGQYV